MKIVPSNRQNFFNVFDEHALLVGLERKVGETNIELHNRIVNRVDGNSTPEGLSDWILDAFDVDAVYPSGIVPSGQLPSGVLPEDVVHEITNKYVFFGTNQPLSAFEYTQLKNPDEAYITPQVYDYDLDQTFSLTQSLTDDQIIDSAGGEWTVYKNPDLSYSNIWVANYAARKVNLIYQVVIEDEVYEVEEKPESERPTI